MTSLPVDSDNNGTLDTWFVDTNSDGLYDQVRYDPGADGYAEVVLIDQDQSGLAETMYVDQDHDGRTDIILYDTDGDGGFDQSSGLLNVTITSPTQPDPVISLYEAAYAEPDPLTRADLIHRLDDIVDARNEMNETWLETDDDDD